MGRPLGFKQRTFLQAPSGTGLSRPGVVREFGTGGDKPRPYTVRLNSCMEQGGRVPSRPRCLRDVGTGVVGDGLVPSRPEFTQDVPNNHHASPSTFRALSRRNFGQTASLRSRFRMSVMMRSSESPIGK